MQTNNNEIARDFYENLKYFQERLHVDENFDVLYRVIHIGGREAAFFFIDGYCKDELMEKILQYFYSITKEQMPGNVYELLKKNMPYVEVDISKNKEDIIKNVLSGVFVLFIEGYESGVLIDSRTYPVRSVQEPEKDKAMRGSKDGFVETIVFNTALIRRRIRDTDLCMRMKSVGRASKTEVVVCYMESRVDQKFLKQLMRKIDRIDVDALTMNQESFAECIFRRKWINPFPKFKYTERPDTAAAHVLEGNIIILVDNSPQAMIMPTSIFDIIDEADDYYFPPVTGTYLRLSRFLIFLLTYFLTPTYLLFTIYPDWIPSSFAFIQIKDTINIPIIFQFLILELAIDGLKLAAVNTPNMLSMPLSVMAALVLGEFSVNSGWFNSEVMLYMAFVAVANYTQSNYELGYALKFMRIITLILTSIFGIYGYIGGIVLFVASILTNKTVANKSYLYPLIPFKPQTALRQFLRVRLHSTEKK